MNKYIIMAIIAIALFLVVVNPIGAQAPKGNNPFPPKSGDKAVSITTYKQQCSGTTKKGLQCKRMIGISQADNKSPRPVYCFSHKQ